MLACSTLGVLMSLEYLFLNLLVWVVTFLIVLYGGSMLFFPKSGPKWVTNHVTKPLFAAPFRLIAYIGSGIANSIHPKKKKGDH